jgi:signal peptidase II
MTKGTAQTSSRAPTLGIVIAVFAVLMDQITKYIMVERVMRPEGVTETPFYSPTIIEILPFFHLRLSWNQGISFSMFSSGSTATLVLLLVLTIGITSVLLWWLWHSNRTWLQVGLGLIVGGALGNIIDRIRFRAVADFLDFHWAGWHFPTFNVADTCISVGLAFWLLDALLEHQHHKASTGEPA